MFLNKTSVAHGSFLHAWQVLRENARGNSGVASLAHLEIAHIGFLRDILGRHNDNRVWVTTLVADSNFLLDISDRITTE